MSNLYDFANHPRSLVNANFWRDGFKSGFQYLGHAQARAYKLAMQQEVIYIALQQNELDIPIWLWNKSGQLTMASCYKVISSRGIISHKLTDNLGYSSAT